MWLLGIRQFVSIDLEGSIIVNYIGEKNGIRISVSSSRVRLVDAESWPLYIFREPFLFRHFPLKT